LAELPSSESPEDTGVWREDGVGRLSAAKEIEEIERAARVQVSAGRIRRMGKVTVCECGVGRSECRGARRRSGFLRLGIRRL
jgi:hypothetical protein